MANLSVVLKFCLLQSFYNSHWVFKYCFTTWLFWYFIFFSEACSMYVKHAITIMICLIIYSWISNQFTYISIVSLLCRLIELSRVTVHIGTTNVTLSKINVWYKRAVWTTCTNVNIKSSVDVCYPAYPSETCYFVIWAFGYW